MCGYFGFAFGECAVLSRTRVSMWARRSGFAAFERGRQLSTAPDWRRWRAREPRSPHGAGTGDNEHGDRDSEGAAGSASGENPDEEEVHSGEGQHNGRRRETRTASLTAWAPREDLLLRRGAYLADERLSDGPWRWRGTLAPVEMSDRR